MEQVSKYFSNTRILDSPVGIETGLWVRGSRVRFMIRYKTFFSSPKHPHVFWAHPSSFSKYTYSRGMKPTIHVHLVSRFRKKEGIPPFPYYVFITCTDTFTFVGPA